MALTSDQLRDAAELVGTAPSLRDAAALWRGRWPEVRAMVVDALDMREEQPALLLGARRVYLAATNGHCWHVTAQADEASALILTQD